MSNQDSRPAFQRILLKLSGEALMGDDESGIDTGILARIAGEILELRQLGVEVGLVIGGGNLFRGAGLAKAGMDRVTADHMGMLATVMNSLAMQDTLERVGVFTRVMSAIRINQVCEDYIRRRAVRHLEKGRVVIFAAGTGNPYFTTDTAAALRAAEIQAQVILKATKVDGVYDRDPAKDAGAKMFKKISYTEALAKNLKVMDAAAISLCRENEIPIRVFNIARKGNIKAVISGKSVGTIVGG